MPESGGFGLYLASFRDFDTKLEEGEQLEAKTTTYDCFKKSSWAVGQLVSGYPRGEVNCNWTFSAPKVQLTVAQLDLWQLDLNAVIEEIRMCKKMRKAEN